MSDLRKALKAQSTKPWVKKAEAGEQGEGIREALKAGRGDIVAGTKKIGVQKEGLSAALKSAKCPAGVKPKAKKK